MLHDAHDPLVSPFLYNSFAPKWGKGIPVPIVRPVQDSVCQLGWIDTQSSQHVESVYNLGHQSVPQLERKVKISCGKGGNERILKSLYCLLHHIDVMI